MDINELQNAAIETAAEHIKSQRKLHNDMRVKMCCITVFACLALICATVLAICAIHEQQETIREQQYALNMQYAGLLDYISGAEITTTYEADSGDNGTAIVGNGNTVSGGELNGNR